MTVESPIIWRRFAETFAGGGATTALASPGVVRFSSRKVSGGGATMAFFESVGGVREDFSPSAGGGPGTGLTASRFATGARENRNLGLGASTTLSRGGGSP